uniref:Uncharacterized protein n=1 Tax=Anopheles quadriannulatus TaxID=34691 RepID=A0A182X3B7_ANOQN
MVQYSTLLWFQSISSLLSSALSLLLSDCSVCLFFVLRAFSGAEDDDDGFTGAGCSPPLLGASSRVVPSLPFSLAPGGSTTSAGVCTSSDRSLSLPDESSSSRPLPGFPRRGLVPSSDASVAELWLLGVSCWCSGSSSPTGPSCDRFEWLRRFLRCSCRLETASLHRLTSSSYGWPCRKHTTITVMLSPPMPPIWQSGARQRIIRFSQICCG